MPHFLLYVKKNNKTRTLCTQNVAWNNKMSYLCSRNIARCKFKVRIIAYLSSKQTDLWQTN